MDEGINRTSVENECMDCVLRDGGLRTNPEGRHDGHRECREARRSPRGEVALGSSEAL